jgi:hypothetical protein
MSKVNLFIVGSAKSGTTSLYDYLHRDNHFYTPKNKEPHFFMAQEGVKSYSGPDDGNVVKRMFVSQLSDYEALYEGGQEYDFRVDASASYLYEKGCAREIHRYNPTAKIVILLRNPINRAFSAYSHMRRDFREPLDSFDEALDAEEQRYINHWMPIWHYQRMGLYTSQVSEYIEVFGESNVLVATFESFMANREEFFHRLYDFLEVKATSDLVWQSEINSNDSRKPKNKSLHLFIRNESVVKSIIKPLVPAAIRKRIIDKVKAVNSGMKVRITANQVERLKKLYNEDVKSLKKLGKVDLSAWVDFTDE